MILRLTEINNGWLSLCKIIVLLALFCLYYSYYSFYLFALFPNCYLLFCIVIHCYPIIIYCDKWYDDMTIWRYCGLAGCLLAEWRSVVRAGIAGPGLLGRCVWAGWQAAIWATSAGAWVSLSGVAGCMRAIMGTGQTMRTSAGWQYRSPALHPCLPYLLALPGQRAHQPISPLAH